MRKIFAIFVALILAIPCLLILMIAYEFYGAPSKDAPQILKTIQSEAGKIAEYHLANNECIAPSHMTARRENGAVVVRQMDDSNGFYYSSETADGIKLYGIFPGEISWDFETDRNAPPPTIYCGKTLVLEKVGSRFNLLSVR
ncbi:hypothetical protein [Neorhizobium alkalisoli]|uniref:Uncharacterized protein n=1 Tax=Neorhizobium alkalisoli TaxID=528178 RepID=A0A561QPM6_9HYPH|nr:hypothetical protein [Neorhizobium alkalisoli]TWF52252.1 hypothetical protein FHW37_105351 [Neorhizobium alkalisoli]